MDLVTSPLSRSWSNPLQCLIARAVASLSRCNVTLLYRAELRKTLMKPRMSRTPGFPIVVTSYEVRFVVYFISVNSHHF